MRINIVRPAAVDLRYQLFSRALHPELFDVCASRLIELPNYDVALKICEAGHLVELRWNGETITELNVDGGREIPKRGCCLSTPLTHGRDVDAEPLPGVKFQASVQSETLEPEVFDRLTQEFHDDVREASLSHIFGNRNRLLPGAISVVFANCGPTSVGIHAFHTFPEDLTVVRTQSLYELA